MYIEYEHNLWEAIHQNGGACDYISENIIKKAKFENGKMLFKNRSYNTILLPEIETLDIETTESLRAFAKAGGKIVFIGKKPFKSPVYKNAVASDSIVNNVVYDILEHYRNNVVIYPSPKKDLIKWYGILQNKLGLNPYVKFDKTHKYLSQSSYQIGGNSMFFIVNASLSEHISVKAEFQVDNKLHPWIWNPETGEKMVYPTNGE